MEKIAELIRGATRPIVTIIFAAVIAQVVVEKIDAPEWFLALASTVILWWFSSRTYERAKTLKTKNEN